MEEDVPRSPQGRDASWNQRLTGAVPNDVRDKRIAIVGCGSVGSFIADELARAGVSRFLLMDPDVVEWANLTRTVYGHADVGQPKVQALARHLRSIFPDFDIETHACRVQDVRDRLPELLDGCDLLLAAVDDPMANGVLDRFAYALGITSVFVGMYKGAKGGELIAVDPRRTPCFSCATGGMRDTLAGVVDSTQVQRDRDYGSNRLVAEVALGTDIHFVCNAAVKACLSLLAGDDADTPLQRFMKVPMDSGVHYVMLGMEPDYFIFPSTHAAASGQHALQSLWLKTTRRPDCPRCGEAEYREPPFEPRHST